jgi:hypothetical protein
VRYRPRSVHLWNVAEPGVRNELCFLSKQRWELVVIFSSRQLFYLFHDRIALDIPIRFVRLTKWSTDSETRETSRC